MLKLRRLVPLRSVKHALRFRRTNSLYVVVLPTFTGKKYFALELSKALPYSTDSLSLPMKGRKRQAHDVKHLIILLHMLALFLTLMI